MPTATVISARVTVPTTGTDENPTPDPLEAARCYRWPHGTNKGKLLADLDAKFLKWVEANSWYADVRAMARAVLDQREASVIADGARRELDPRSLDELVFLLIRSNERIYRLEVEVAQLREQVAALSGIDPS